MKTLSSALPILGLTLLTACSDNPGSGAPFGAGGEGSTSGSAGSWVGGKGGGTVAQGGSGAGGTGSFGAGGGTLGSAGKPTTGDAGKGGGAPATGVRALCDAYVACIAAANPAVLGPIADAYGKQGNCFDQGDEALCEKACKTGLVQAHGSYPKIADCNYCDSAKDCGPSAPACDTKEHVCKACSQDAHCKDDALPACDVSTFTCVACNANGGCDANSNRPVCDVASHSCAPCSSNDDCSGQAGSGRGICGTSGKCRGCANDGECGGGRCDTSMQRCVQCLEDQDCEGGGTCDPLNNTCCGAGVCAEKGFACGATSVLGCGAFFGTQIFCGSCEGGQHCDDHQCVDPPAPGCDATCGPKERCGYDADSNTRLCLPQAAACKDNLAGGCGPGFSCESKESSYPPYDRYYFCVAECLIDADCPPQGGTAGKCVIFPGETGLCQH